MSYLAVDLAAPVCNNGPLFRILTILENEMASNMSASGSDASASIPT